MSESEKSHMQKEDRNMASTTPLTKEERDNTDSQETKDEAQVYMTDDDEMDRREEERQLELKCEDEPEKYEPDDVYQ